MSTMKAQDNDTVRIDGAVGEGGGQVLRTALCLSIVSGRPLTIDNIRAGRKKPGLLRQHLTAVKAATRIGSADTTGAELGSTGLTFRPGALTPGDYTFAVGTAGSATLVLQTVLPALLTATEPSTLTLKGGTHNPYAPPFDFLDKAFLPLIRRMGPRVDARLERPGFYPAGGGRFVVSIQPCATLRPLRLLERGAVRRRRAIARIAGGVSHAVARRELEKVKNMMALDESDLHVDDVKDSAGPGNTLTIELESEAVTEVFTGFGERDVSSERVAAKAVRQARAYLAAEVPVGEYLADQLLVPMALAGRGSFRTVPPSRHTTTNVEVIRSFLDVRIDIDRQSRKTARIDIGTGEAKEQT